MELKRVFNIRINKIKSKTIVTKLNRSKLSGLKHFLFKKNSLTFCIQRIVIVFTSEQMETVEE